MLEFFRVVFRHAPPTGLIRYGPLVPPTFITMEQLEIIEPDRTDLYFGPAVRREARPTKDAVWGGSTAWLDFDGHGMQTSLIPPSIVVASGGPGKFHYYWLLNRFVDPKTLEACNKALEAHHQENGGTWDCTRVLRVPGTVNTKYNPPTDVKVVGFYPDRVYDPDDLCRLKPYNPKILKVTKTRSERDWAVGRVLLSWGISEEAITLALNVLSEKSGETPGYVERTVAKLFAVCASGGEEGTPEGASLANFYVEPKGRLIGPRGEDEGMIIRVAWEDGDMEIPASQQDFSSKRTVNMLLERWGLRSRIWSGSDRQATELWLDLVEQSSDEDSILAVRRSGRYDTPSGPVFVYGSRQALGADHSVFWVSMQGYNRPLDIAPGFWDRDEIPRLLFRLNRPPVIEPVLGWLLATPFKPLIESLGVRFPILQVFGMRGSGKTTLLRTLMPLLGCSGEPLGADVTRFALTAALSASNAVPVWIGEFRSGLDRVNEMMLLLRLNYDGGWEERGQSDLSVVRFELGAPVVVDGESQFPDSAVRERTLSVRLVQSDIVEGTEYSQALSQLSVHKPTFSHFAYDYLSWTLTVDRQLVEIWLTRGLEAFKGKLPFSRLLHTAAVALLGLYALCEFIPGIPEPNVSSIYEAMLNLHVPDLGVATPVERLVEIVTHLYRQGRPEIRPCVIWDPNTKVLWINLTSVLHWVRRNYHDMPDRDTFIPQFEERVGTYILPSKRVEGGVYYGIDLVKAQELGLDCPFPRDIGIGGYDVEDL